MKDKEIRRNLLSFEKFIDYSKLYGAAFLYCLFFGYKGISMFPIQSEIFCRRDVFVTMTYPLWYSLIFLLPITITTISLVKYDFLPMCVIQNHSWKSLLWKQQKKIGMQSLFYSSVFLVVIFFWTSGMTVSNWERMGSYFYQKTDSTSQVITIEFFIIIFIVCFIRNYIMGQVLLLSLWKKATPVYGVLLLCGIICFEMAIAKYPILLRLFTIDYFMWVDKTMRIKIVGGVLFYSIIFGIWFRQIVKKKEWIRCQLPTT